MFIFSFCIFHFYLAYRHRAPRKSGSFLLLYTCTNTGHLDLSQGVYSGHLDLSQGVYSGHLDLSQGVYSGHLDLSQGVYSGHLDLSQGVYSGHLDLSQGVYIGHLDLSRGVYKQWSFFSLPGLFQERAVPFLIESCVRSGHFESSQTCFKNGQFQFCYSDLLKVQPCYAGFQNKGLVSFACYAALLKEWSLWSVCAIQVCYSSGHCGLWSLVCGLWSLVSVVYGHWSVVYGLCGLWSLVYGHCGLWSLWSVCHSGLLLQRSQSLPCRGVKAEVHDPVSILLSLQQI